MEWLHGVPAEPPQIAALGRPLNMRSGNRRRGAEDQARPRCDAVAQKQVPFPCEPVARGFSGRRSCVQHMQVWRCSSIRRTGALSDQAKVLGSKVLLWALLGFVVS